jgi:hypothetical protein
MYSHLEDLEQLVKCKRYIALVQWNWQQVLSVEDISQLCEISSCKYRAINSSKYRHQQF